MSRPILSPHERQNTYKFHDHNDAKFSWIRRIQALQAQLLNPGSANRIQSLVVTEAAIRLTFTTFFGLN